MYTQEKVNLLTINNRASKNINPTPSFRGGNLITPLLKSNTTTSLMKKIENPIYGLLFVNFTSLVIPRIYIDSKRNKYAGAETAFYELSSTATNYALPGLIALGVAKAAEKFNNPLGINTKGWVDNQTTESLGNLYKQSIVAGNKEKTLDNFLENSLKRIKGHNGSDLVWKGLDENPNIIQELKESLKTSILSDKNLNKDSAKKIAHSIANEIGAFDNVKISGIAPAGKDLNVNLPKYISNVEYLAKQFQKSHTSESTPVITNNISGIIKKIKGTNKFKTLISLGIVCGIGFAVPFINRHITKKRTGKDDFVGYSDFCSDLPKEKEKMTENKLQKLSFKGYESSQFLPTQTQLKSPIYPIGIIGRLFASRGKDEVREVGVKSGFTYLNFLIIPSLFANIVAAGFKNKHVFNNLNNENLIKNTDNIFGKIINKIKSINNLKLRSYDDIEIYAKSVGEKLSTLKEQEFKKHLTGLIKDPSILLNDLKTTGKEQRASVIAESIKKELNGIKNISKFAGIAYSCLTLGIGINLLNVYMTNKSREKQLLAMKKNNAEINNSKSAISLQAADFFKVHKQYV